MSSSDAGTAREAWCAFAFGAVPIIWGVFKTGPTERQMAAPVILGGSDEVIRNVGAGLLVFVDLLVTVQEMCHVRTYLLSGRYRT